eukprot:124272-Chlamydomonas_euryale.AAC.3
MRGGKEACCCRVFCEQRASAPCHARPPLRIACHATRAAPQVGDADAGDSLALDSLAQALHAVLGPSQFATLMTGVLGNLADGSSTFSRCADRVASARRAMERQLNTDFAGGALAFGVGLADAPGFVLTGQLAELRATFENHATWWDPFTAPFLASAAAAAAPRASSGP